MTKRLLPKEARGRCGNQKCKAWRKGNFCSIKTEDDALDCNQQMSFDRTPEYAKMIEEQTKAFKLLFPNTSLDNYHLILRIAKALG